MITKQQAMTKDEFHIRSHHRCSHWRRNGKTQTWKRDPERFRVPIKHGLYAYGQLTSERHRDSPLVHVASECPFEVSDEFEREAAREVAIARAVEESRR